MRSCIYKGSLLHHRYLPRENRFAYSVFFMFLDIAELGQVFDNSLFWSFERFNIASFRRSDYLGPAHIPLDKAVRDRVEKEQGRRPEGPIRMLTHLRYYGHCFNPVTFYYCYDVSDTRVEYIVAEITNTPWRERHSYVLGEEQNLETVKRKRFRFQKAFHVSPFMDMDYLYDWRFRGPGKWLKIHMINIKEDNRCFEAVLSLKREEINGPALAWVLVRFPVMTLKVLAMIYWQAFRLWLKKTPYYDHPEAMPEKTYE